MTVKFFKHAPAAVFISILAFSSSAWAPKGAGNEKDGVMSSTHAPVKAKDEKSTETDPILYVIKYNSKSGKQAQLVITHFRGKMIDQENASVSKNVLAAKSLVSGQTITLRRRDLPKTSDFPSEAIEISLLTSNGRSELESSEETTGLVGSDVIDPKTVDPLGLFRRSSWKTVPGSKITLSPLYDE